MLRLCLRAVLQHTKNLAPEIFSVDSATEEDTEMLLREEFPHIHFFPHRKNVGFRALVNLTLAKATGEHILLLNSDIILTPGSVETLQAFLLAHPLVGMVGPGLLNFNGALQPSCFRFYKLHTILYRRTFLKNLSFAKKHLAWFEMRDYDHDRPRGVDWLMGSAFMVTRSAISIVGPMDKRFFMYMEDVDWCRRFWENDLEVVYLPQTAMYHYYGKGSARGGFWGSLLFNRLTWIHIFSATKYFLKYVGRPLPKHGEKYYD